MDSTRTYGIINRGYTYFLEVGSLILGKFKCGRRSALKSQNAEVIVDKIRSNGISPRCFENDLKQDLFYEEVKTKKSITNLSWLISKMSHNFKKMAISSTDSNFKFRIYEEAIKQAAVIARKADAVMESKIPKLVKEATKELAIAAANFASLVTEESEKVIAINLLDQVEELTKIVDQISDDELLHTVTKETFNEVLKLTSELEVETTAKCEDAIDNLDYAILMLMEEITNAEISSKSLYPDYYGKYKAVKLDEVRTSLLKAEQLSLIYNQNPEKFNNALRAIENIVQEIELQKTLPASFYIQLQKIIVANRKIEGLFEKALTAIEDEIEASQLALRAEMCVELL